ncbi:WxL domain-containing protein [Lactococcus laudensis]|uniref:WxL domain-containing protein n=2 Tax=Pseudolactococcus laudensis TaxID=1494461 RepID=A0A7V8MZJ7_9LACT|nr:LPXTG cell wall anchor domain-containing protein [Lactococcus laudensis]MBA0015890.1 WxL domain-containing protein [Lactococcus laudensis]
MKNIKLLSTLALSASLLSVGSVAVSAAVINATGTATETSVGSASFVTDNTTIVTPQVPGGKGPDTLPPGPENPDTVDPNVKASDLALYAHPTEFNFGVTKISAADKQKSTVVLTQKKWATVNNNADGTDTTDPAKLHQRDFQSLRLQDGRVNPKDWTISAEASTFKDGAKTLTGASINIASATDYTSDPKGKVSALKDFKIEADGKTVTSDILKADPEARFTSDLSWNTDKVTLEFSGAVIDTVSPSYSVTSCSIYIVKKTSQKGRREMMYPSFKEKYKENTVKKTVKYLLLSLLTFTSIGSFHVSAETYGDFKVEKAVSVPAPTPAPSGGSGVVSASNLPMTGEQVAAWGVLVGLLLLAVALLLFVIKKRREQEKSQTCT